MKRIFEKCGTSINVCKMIFFSRKYVNVQIDRQSTKAQALIKEKVRNALANLKNFKLFEFQIPVTMEIRFKHKNDAARASWFPGAKRTGESTIDSTHNDPGQDQISSRFRPVSSSFFLRITVSNLVKKISLVAPTTASLRWPLQEMNSLSPTTI